MPRKGHEIDAAEIRLSFVNSLYIKRGTLFTGMIAHVVTVLAVYLHVQDGFYLVWAGLMFAIWALRALDMRAFDRCDKSGFTMIDTLRWERRYVAGSLVAAFGIGTMCAYALIVSKNSFAELATISVTIATLISVVGRNFGSKLNVDMIILAACLPMMVGFMLADEPFMIVLAVLLLPLFLTTRSLANGVREFLFDAVTSERKAAQLAERFDTALNNMSHGLFMLDGHGRIEVTNHKAREIIGLSDSLDLNGRAFHVALRLGARSGAIPQENLKPITEKLTALAAGLETRVLVKFDHQTWFEFSSRKRNGNGVVIIFEDVTSRITQEEKILRMARFDSLTGLPNRTWFSDVVTEKLSRTEGYQQVGLAVLDLDDFKHINDTMGHVAGDRMLQALAERMKVLSKNRIIASRFGGDEFVLFFPSVPDIASVNELMDEVIQALRGTYMVEGHRIFLTLSGGVALADAGSATLEDLHIRADLALYDAKRRDKNRWSLFVESMDAKYTARQKLKIDLREAIRTGVLGIAYQPMFRPDGGRILGAEALSRWNHPELGAVSPAVYVPLAEEIGIVSDLTRGMIDRAIRDCLNWPEELFVSVNLSAYDLRSRDIVAFIADALGRHGLPPGRLHLEITESALMDDLLSVGVTLRELREMGINIAIDDFGTGYSSLSYLDILPLNKVKIDRAFVANITEDARKLELLRGIVTLSRGLGLEIVIEGVETEAQLEIIRKNDCADIIQGFIFGAPMPAGPFSDLIGRAVTPDKLLEAVPDGCLTN